MAIGQADCQYVCCECRRRRQRGSAAPLDGCPSRAPAAHGHFTKFERWSKVERIEAARHRMGLSAALLCDHGHAPAHARRVVADIVDGLDDPCERLALAPKARRAEAFRLGSAVLSSALPLIQVRFGCRASEKQFYYCPTALGRNKHFPVRHCPVPQALPRSRAPSCPKNA